MTKMEMEMEKFEHRLFEQMVRGIAFSDILITVSNWRYLQEISNEIADSTNYSIQQRRSSIM
jgi:hypothetical protein